MMRLFVFFGFLFSIFGIYLSRYISQYREAYELWVQEVVYYKDTINESENKSEKQELCGKTESLANELCQIADSIFLLFTILCLTYLITASTTIFYLKAQKCSILNDCEKIILTASLIISTIIFLLLPEMLKNVHIHILNPSKTSKIDEKIFDVWYKYKCFERKYGNYKYKLQPRRLYEILARRSQEKEKTFDGKDIEIPKDIEKEMEKNEFFQKKRLNP